MAVRSNFSSLALVGLVLLIGGCSVTKLYKNELAHNLEVNSKTDSVETTLDICSVGAQCASEYPGRVALDRGLVGLGIESEKPSYLVAGFAHSSFLE